MKEALKGIGATVVGIAFLLATLAIPVVLIKGGLWAANHLLPVLVNIGSVVLAVDILVLLPLSLSRSLRPFTVSTLVISSYVFGATLWLTGLALTYYLWGLFAVLVGLFIFGVGVVPIALLATRIKGMWAQFWSLWLLLVLTFMFRFIGIFIGSSIASRSRISGAEVA